MAYELKKLGAKIAENMKAAGLPAVAEADLEKAAHASYEGVKEWLKEGAAETETKVDDVLVSFSSYADAFVDAEINKIDLDGDGK